MASVQQLSSLLSNMRETLDRLCKQNSAVGGLSDGPLLRQELNKTVKELGSISKQAKSTIIILKENGEEIHDYESEFEKISENMKNVLPEIIQKLREQQEEQPTGGSLSVTAPLMAQEEVDMETENIENLEIQVREILSTMRELHEIFTKTLEELQRQRNVLVSVDEQISAAQDSVKDGNQQLDAAHQHQKASTRCLCWIALFFLIICAGIGIFLGIKYGTSKPSSSPSPSPAAIKNLRDILNQ